MEVRPLGLNLYHFDGGAVAAADSEMGGGGDVAGRGPNLRYSSFLAFGFEEVEAHGVGSDRVTTEVERGVRKRVLRLERRAAGVADHQRVDDIEDEALPDLGERREYFADGRVTVQSELFEAAHVVHSTQCEVVEAPGYAAGVVVHQDRHVDKFSDGLAEQCGQVGACAEGFVSAEFQVAPDEFAGEFAFVKAFLVPAGVADDGDHPVRLGGGGRRGGPAAVAHFAGVAIPHEDIGGRDAGSGETSRNGVDDFAMGDVQRPSQCADFDADDVVGVDESSPGGGFVGLAGKRLNTGGNEGAHLGGVDGAAVHGARVAGEDDAALGFVSVYDTDQCER